MIRIAVSLFFALCLTLASSAHLMAQPLGAIGYAPTTDQNIAAKKCQRTLKTATSAKIHTSQFCIMTTSSQIKKNHHRCQIDISPIVTTAQNLPDGSAQIRVEQDGVMLDRYTTEPALEPPRPL